MRPPDGRPASVDGYVARLADSANSIHGLIVNDRD
jgi:hypothetical protein